MECLKDYNVDSVWPKIEEDDPKRLIKRLIELEPSGSKIGYHGACQDWKCIRSSLDIHFEKAKINTHDKRKKEETKLLRSFQKKAYPLLPPGGKRHIDLARYRWDTIRNSGTLFVGRHYLLKTRCVDWTFNQLAALFFACQKNPAKPGVIWWMNYHQFTHALACQWPRIYGKSGYVEDDFEVDFIDGKEVDVFIRFHYPEWMERPITQKAWITMSGKYGVHHDEAIYRLGVRSCGRLIIKADMKFKLLDMLERWGVNKKSLGFGSSCLDARIEKIAKDVAVKQ